MTKPHEVIQLPGLTGEDALRQGLVPVPPEMVEQPQAMTAEEQLAWASEQMVRTEKPGGAVLVQPVGPLMARARETRTAKNQAKRVRRARRGKR